MAESMDEHHCDGGSEQDDAKEHPTYSVFNQTVRNSSKRALIFGCRLIKGSVTRRYYDLQSTEQL